LRQLNKISYFWYKLYFYMKKYYLLALLTIVFSTLIFVSCSKDEQYISQEDKLPIATDDVVSNTLLSSVEINVLFNDATGDAIVPSTVSIIGGTDTNSNGTLDKLIVPNEGVWQVNAQTGVITFTPQATFVGNPTQISYTVNDVQNNKSNAALVTINAIPIVNNDLTQVPYPNLSDYHFFVGDLKEQIPSLNVLPFQPASSLFTDYAHKKRFVWMPIGSKATYNGDEKVLELPVGAALIKTFYYDNVQNVTPVGATRIIETRIMIRKSTGWIFANYIWNTEQTEAHLDLNGSYTAISWKDENNVIKSANYRIPNEVQCIVCHKSNALVNNQLVIRHIPIGIKPQNLNFNYNYGTETKNQLTKWIEKGYLENNFNLPSQNNTTVDYNDTSKSIELRARSYVDINCAHCHQAERHCDYRPMRFAFIETGAANGVGRTNMGVCVNTSDMQDFDPNLSKVVTPGKIDKSMMYFRLNTTNEAYRMPLHGRSIIHDEGIALIQQWINSLSPCN
jgi:uncharacterized repeat protein (TIGR03806 family)